MNLELGGKVAAITGSTRGIGRATALRLGEEGCSVGISGRTKSTLDDTIAAFGSNPVHGVEVDLLTAGGVERFIDETAARFGRLDCVVASVGGTVGGNFLDTEPDAWLKTFELNTLLAVRAIRAAAPHFAKVGAGSVVIVASISGSKPGPRAQYGASKAAEISLAASLAKELAPQKIRINAVSPGSIMWPGGSWHQRSIAMPEKIGDFIAREFPSGRMGTLDEVADVISFLLSARASWVNGANIVIDGAQGHPSVRL